MINKIINDMQGGLQDKRYHKTTANSIDKIVNLLFNNNTIEKG